MPDPDPASPAFINERRYRFACKNERIKPAYAKVYSTKRFT